MNKFVYLANRLALAVVLVSLLSLLTACSEKEKLPASKAFCQAAERYNNELQNAERLGEADVDRQLPIVQELARTAPKKIKDDATVCIEKIFSDLKLRVCNLSFIDIKFILICFYWLIYNTFLQRF